MKPLTPAQRVLLQRLLDEGPQPLRRCNKATVRALERQLLVVVVRPRSRLQECSVRPTRIAPAVLALEAS